jgi:class 3 adenylate cyclase/pimeloyl-ACP methyl ester carboxylesterase
VEPRIRYARTSDGANIAYGVVGVGPPLLVVRVLLRQAVDDELSSDSDAPWLALAEKHAVVAWDPRGFGLSAASAPEYTLESSVRDLEAVADAVHADRFDLLGHLTPSHTALAYAARHGERVRRLALWNPSPPGGSMRVSTMVGMPDILHTHFHEFWQLAALRTFGWERARTAKKWVDHITRQFTAESWDRVMTELEHIDSTPEWGGITASTLVIAEPGVTSFAVAAFDRGRLFRQQLVSTIPGAELTTIKPGDANGFAEVAARFFATGEEPAVAPPSGTAVILFADVVDSTAITARLGNEAFRERTRQLEDALRTVIREAGGSPVAGRTLGDGVLGDFTSAAHAISAALQCEQHAERVGLQLHLGIHAGDVIREPGGGVSGIAVSIASRISDLTAPNEILVSSTVRDLARASSDVTFEDRGEHALKGVGEPQRVYAVRASRSREGDGM